MAAPTHIRETRDFARELKFLVDKAVGDEIRAWARGRLAPDPFGGGEAGDSYATTSLYFETADLCVYKRRGSYGRAKYRVRRYGLADNIWVERKLRTDTLLAKRRTPVGLDGLERLGSDTLDPGWPGYWFHARIRRRHLRPRVQVSYERTARLGRNDYGTIRLTLDDNLRSLPMPDRAFLPGTGYPLLDAQNILELKYRIEMPAIFKELVERFKLQPQPVSKFRLGLDAMGYLPVPARTTR
jgi:hypothetical protein